MNFFAQIKHLVNPLTMGPIPLIGSPYFLLNATHDHRGWADIDRLMTMSLIEAAAAGALD